MPFKPVENIYKERGCIPDPVKYTVEIPYSALNTNELFRALGGAFDKVAKWLHNAKGIYRASDGVRISITIFPRVVQRVYTIDPFKQNGEGW